MQILIPLFLSFNNVSNTFSEISFFLISIKMCIRDRVYNDNVNDPKIKKWLGEVVGKEMCIRDSFTPPWRG